MNIVGRRPAFPAVGRPTAPAVAAPRKLGLLPAFGAWLAGLAAFTVLGVEALFVEDHLVFHIARWTAYLTAALVATSHAGRAAKRKTPENRLQPHSAAG